MSQEWEGAPGSVLSSAHILARMSSWEHGDQSFVHLDHSWELCSIYILSQFGSLLVSLHPP